MDVWLIVLAVFVIVIVGLFMTMVTVSYTHLTLPTN